MLMEGATKQHGNRYLESALASSSTMHQSVVSSTECKSSLTRQSAEDVSTNTTTNVTNAGSNNDDSSRVSAASGVHEKIGDRNCDRSAWQLANEAFVLALNLRTTSSHNGLNSMHCSRILEKISNTSLNLHNYDDALDAMKESLEIRKTILPVSDPRTIRTVHQIGHVHLQRGRLPAALAVYQLSLTLLSSLPTRDLMMEGSAFSVIGQISNDLGKFRFPAKALKTAIVRKAELLGNEASELCPDFFALGTAYRKLRMPKLAVEAYTKCISIALADADSDATLTTSALLAMAKIYGKIGKLELSKTHLLGAIAMERMKDTPSRSCLVRLFRNLSKMHYALDELEQAIHSCREAAEIGLYLVVESAGCLGNATCAKLWMDLGELLLKKGDCNGCQLAMEVAKRLHPSLAASQQSQSHYYCTQQPRSHRLPLHLLQPRQLNPPPICKFHPPSPRIIIQTPNHQIPYLRHTQHSNRSRIRQSLYISSFSLLLSSP